MTSPDARPESELTGDDRLSTEAELVAAGWERGFVAKEPRLTEWVETYREMGFEVRLLPVPLDDDVCTECMRQDPEQFRLIYIRRTEPA